MAFVTFMFAAGKTDNLRSILLVGNLVAVQAVIL